MSISGTWLLTGLRGNGKTLRAVQLMTEEVASGRQVFASNFTDLNVPGVEVWDDPKQWQELPPGSVLFVDEAQRYWRARRAGDVPPEVVAMETQRHDGISMVLLTQQPTYLDKHVRGLVDRHFHLVRRAGLPASQVYEWERCKEEPESPANLELAEAAVWTFPKHLYGSYKSAEVHTVKRRLPARLKLIAGGVLVVAGLFWWAISSLKGDVHASEPDAAVVSAEGDTSAVQAAPTPRTAESIAASMTPRIAGAIWTAPIYDAVLKVQQPGKLACMIGSECRCLTDQGTRFNIGQAECKLIVKNGGIYNPYLQTAGNARTKSDTGQRQPGAGHSPAAMASNDAAVSSGATISAPQMSGYGDIGVGQDQAAPR